MAHRTCRRAKPVIKAIELLVDNQAKHCFTPLLNLYSLIRMSPGKLPLNDLPLYSMLIIETHGPYCQEGKRGKQKFYPDRRCCARHRRTDTLVPCTIFSLH